MAIHSSVDRSQSEQLFMRLFQMGKWFSGFFALIALLILAAVSVVTISYILPPRLQVPEFNSVNENQQSNADAPSNAAGIDLKLQQEILRIVAEFIIDAEQVKSTTKALSKLDEGSQSSFILGWKKYLVRGIAAARQSNTFNEKTTTSLSLDYSRRFSAAYESRTGSASTNIVQLFYAGIIAMAAMMVFIISIIVPVLVQIERNTRIKVVNTG